MIDVTCSCGKAFSVPDSYAGKRGKCGRCQGWLAIPELPSPELQDHGVVSAEQVDLEPVVAIVEGTVKPPGPRGPAMPGAFPSRAKDQWERDAWREPWYYGLLAFSGYTSIWLGPGASILLIVYAFTESELVPAARINLLCFSVGLALSLLAFGSALLVGLDAARHVRATRIFTGSIMRGCGFNIPL
jgi:hypothetical protein